MTYAELVWKLVQELLAEKQKNAKLTNNQRHNEND